MAEQVPAQRLHHRVKTHVVKRWESTLASDQSTNALIFFLVVAAGVFFLAVAYLAMHPIASFSVKDKVSQLSAVAVVTAPFACEYGKSITALFSHNEVRVTLSDGREITLPEVTAASGARYANPDDSFVFWNKGNTAFIDENGERTYDGCVTNG